MIRSDVVEGIGDVLCETAVYLNVGLKDPALRAQDFASLVFDISAALTLEGSDGRAVKPWCSASSCWFLSLSLSLSLAIPDTLQYKLKTFPS